MIKTAQRPASTGKPHYGTSSAAGLLLNFSPLQFDDAEVDAGVFPYGADGDEVLKRTFARRFHAQEQIAEHDVDHQQQPPEVGELALDGREQHGEDEQTHH